MTHTPGPWHTRLTKNGDSIHSSDGRPICLAPSAAYIPNFVKGREEVQANFYILAAAPDLLGALEELLEDYEAVARITGLGPECFELIRKARAAIAKTRRG